MPSLNEGCLSTDDIAQDCVDLIAGLALSDFEAKDRADVVRYNYRTLLGPNAIERINDTLKTLFRVTPSSGPLDVTEIKNRLKVHMDEAVPTVLCKCSRCRTQSFEVMIRKRLENCSHAVLWSIVGRVIESGVAGLFVVTKGEIAINFPFWGYWISHDVNLSLEMGQPASAIHRLILCLVDPTIDVELNVGVSSGLASVIPSTVIDPVFRDPRCVEYLLIDGGFHDGRNYFKGLVVDQKMPKRPHTMKSLVRSGSEIPVSNIGCHSSLTILGKGILNELQLKTVVQVSTKIVYVDFLETHLAHMRAETAGPCCHGRNRPLDKKNSSSVIATSVAAPKASRSNVVAVVLTRQNPEAQFLACVQNTKILFQGPSCLNCAVKTAKEFGYKVVIEN